MASLPCPRNFYWIRLLDQPDNITVGIFGRGDQPASTNVFDLLDCLCSGVHEGLQTFLDIVHVIIDCHPFLKRPKGLFMGGRNLLMVLTLERKSPGYHPGLGAEKTLRLSL